MKPLYLNLFFLLCASIVSAQSFMANYTYQNTSLETVTSAASIAMGESFVANPYSVSSFLENPANLSGIKEMGLFYNYRSHDWSDYAKNFNYNSVGLTTLSSWGNIGLSLSQYSTGVNVPDIYGSGRSPNDVNRTYSLSIGRRIFSNLSVGLSLKIFNHNRTENSSSGDLESNNAYLVDLGLLYNVFHFENPSMQQELNIGTVIQNLGTMYKEKDNYFYSEFQNVRLPRYFKFGFSYNLQIRNSSGSNDVEATLSGQYKGYINPPYETPDVDYWGGGIEVKIKNVFAARVGVIQLPEYRVYLDRATPILRYGFGLFLPLEKIGVKIPLTVSADYSFIPIKDSGLLMESDQTKKMMHAFSLSLRYNSIFF